MTKGRRAARRSALFALYKWDLTGKVELDEDADEYTLRTVEEVQSRLAGVRVTLPTIHFCSCRKDWPLCRFLSLVR